MARPTICTLAGASALIACCLGVAGQSARADSERCAPGAPRPPGGEPPPICPHDLELGISAGPSITDIGQGTLVGAVLGVSVGLVNNDTFGAFSWGGRVGAGADFIRGSFGGYLELNASILLRLISIGIGPGLRAGDYWNVPAGTDAVAAAGIHFSGRLAVPLNADFGALHSNWNETRLWQVGVEIDGLIGWAFGSGRSVFDLAPMLFLSYDFGNFE